MGDFQINWILWSLIRLSEVHSDSYLNSWICMPSRVERDRKEALSREFGDIYHLDNESWRNDGKLCFNLDYVQIIQMRAYVQTILIACTSFIPFIIRRHNLNFDILRQAILEMEGIEQLLPPRVRDHSTPCGLRNPGKVCFANVIIQALFNIFPFRRIM